MQTIYSSPFGLLVLIAHNGCLVYCNWDDPSCFKKFSRIKKEVSPHSELNVDSVLLSTVRMQLDGYFQGLRKEFDFPVSLIGTDFQKEVWKTLRIIPYGQTVSYKEIGESIGIPASARAVANACGANPLSVVFPCHRVVVASGRLGGYTGGVEKKRFLLNLEFLHSGNLTAM